MANHYGEDAIDVQDKGNQFLIVFTNKATGGQVQMTIPKMASLYKTPGPVDAGTALKVAREVAHALRVTLE